MTARNDAIRKVSAEVAIPVLLCAGAWYFLALPVEQRLASVTAERQECDSVLAHLHAAESRARLLERERRSLEAIDRIGSVQSIRDEAELIYSLTMLAESKGMRVGQVQPVSPPEQHRLSPRANQDQQEAQHPGPADTTLSFSLDMTGPYESLVSMLAELERSGTTVGVRELRIAPGNAQSPASVAAHLITDHHFFELPPVAPDTNQGGEE